MKFIKRYRFSLLVLSSILLFFIIAPSVLPKYSTRMMILAILMIFELFIWQLIRKTFPNLILKKARYRLLALLFWLPLFCILILMVVAALHPIITWPPPVFTYSFGCIIAYYSCKILLILSLILGELANLTRMLIRRLQKKEKLLQNPYRKFAIKFGSASGGVLLMLMLVGNVLWLNRFDLQKVDLRLSDLPRSFDGLRIVQISDIHLGSYLSQAPLQEAVDIILELKPDMIFFTGDLVNNFSGEAIPYLPILRRLHAPLGIYSVLGNHDYGDYLPWKDEQEKAENLKNLIKWEQECGWQVLLNQYRIIEINHEKIAILGIENWSNNKHFPKKGNITKALSGCEEVTCKLLLSHDPTAWGAHIKPEHGINITFSGHTHGMQFGWQSAHYRWSPAAWLYDFWAGLAKKTSPGFKTQYLYVNTGLGSVGIPSRIGILPEITLFTLHCQ